jgi:hypothetical protein
MFSRNLLTTTFAALTVSFATATVALAASSTTSSDQVRLHDVDPRNGILVVAQVERIGPKQDDLARSSRTRTTAASLLDQSRTTHGKGSLSKVGEAVDWRLDPNRMIPAHSSRTRTATIGGLPPIRTKHQQAKARWSHQHRALRRSCTTALGH